MAILAQANQAQSASITMEGKKRIDKRCQVYQACSSQTLIAGSADLQRHWNEPSQLLVYQLELDQCLCGGDAAGQLQYF